MSEGFLEIFGYDQANPMLFNSGLFLILFTVFLSIYSFIYKFKLARTLYVVAFSFYFYFKSSGHYLVILLFSILLDYLVAWHIFLQTDERERKFWLIFSVTANVLLLLYFKYTNFFLENFSLLTKVPVPHLDLILPIGISFYTFQTISYVVDVYNRKIEPAKNLWDYAFYMSFFPHLVAGPIVRASHFLPQVYRKLIINKDEVSEGIYLVLKGLIKKAIIADYVSQYVDLVFGTPSGYSGFENLMAIYAYTLQIYCDFSGYSDMAMGFAKMTGFDLGINFNSPYQAKNLTDFWRRWHISLSSWLRDYIYIPLGGNRKGELNQNFNLFATMLIGGLWHGASWKFVFWGGAHGAGLIINKITDKIFKRNDLNKNTFLNIIGWLITFHFVAFLWVFFRAENFNAAIELIGKIFSSFDAAYILPFIKVRALLLLILIIGFAFHFLKNGLKNKMLVTFIKSPLIIKILLTIFIIQVVLQIRSENVQPFIYFQF